MYVCALNSMPIFYRINDYFPFTIRNKNCITMSTLCIPKISNEQYCVNVLPCFGLILAENSYSVHNFSMFDDVQHSLCSFLLLPVSIWYRYCFRIADPSQRENLGIIVQYKVKVKLCIGGPILGGWVKI